MDRIRWPPALADAQAQLAKLVSVVGPASGQSMGESGFEDAMYIEAGCSGMSETACHLAGKYPGGAARGSRCLWNLGNGPTVAGVLMIRLGCDILVPVS